MMPIASLEAPRSGSSERTSASNARAGLDLRTILIMLFATLGVQNILLWRFLDFAPAWLYLVAASLLAITAYALRQTSFAMEQPRVPLSTALVCTGAAFLLCLLGGQGGVFYINVDWQVRNAMLNDMVVHPWPFAYTARSVPEVLRGQLGMYFIPALAGKLFGLPAAHPALLLQNTLFLGAVFATASTLFNTVRSRILALVVFVFFSGMDIVGHAVATVFSPDYFVAHHIEGWSSVQFSSHMTQIFWVPHHALSGWLAAMLFLLWKSGRMRVTCFLATIPLLLIWSPLVVIGVMPFAIYAGLASLKRREVGWAEIVLPAAALALSIPVILYLSADNDTVGNSLFAIGPINYILFQSLEVFPFVAAVVLISKRGRFGWSTLLILLACLLLVPFYKIGQNSDFAMRGSTASLAILSMMVVDALLVSFAGTKTTVQRLVGLGLAAALALGSVTGLLEIWRAIAYHPAPPLRCSIIGAWDRQEIDITPEQKKVYIAPVASLPRPIRPVDPTLVPYTDPDACWDRPWKLRREAGPS